MKKIPLSVIENAINRLNCAGALFVKSAKSTANRNGLFLDAVQHVEEMCVAMRKVALHYATSDTKREAILNQSADILEISVDFTVQGYLHIRIPRILPGKKKADNSEFIIAPLRRKLSKMRNIPFSHDLQTLVIQHNYRADTPETLIRDHDNYETKRISDVICYYCMPDDSIKFCERLYISAPAETESTDIWVLPAAKLPTWLAEHKNNPLPTNKNNPL